MKLQNVLVMNVCIPICRYCYTNFFHRQIRFSASCDIIGWFCMFPSFKIYNFELIEGTCTSYSLSNRTMKNRDFPNLNILVSNTISDYLLYSTTAILHCHPKQTTDTASLS